MLQRIDRYFGLITVITILVGYFFIYDQHIAVDPILARDDRALLKPMFQVSDLASYFEMHKTNEIKDAQPVRDLTFFLNAYLRANHNISLFHFVNMLISLGVTLLFYKLMIALKFSRNISLIATLILAFHPIFVSSVGWISARKHSLSMLFILLAIVDIFKTNRLSKKSVLYYTLSIFSHPITILFPAWVILLRLFGIIKKLSFNFYFLCTACLIGFYVNYIKFLFLGYGNTVKVVARSYFSTISTATLSFGRSLVLLFYPHNFSAEYHEGHIDNLIGLAIFGLLILIYKKFAPLKHLIIWIGLFLCVNATYIQYFMNETYLYLPLITQIILISYLVTHNLFHKRLATKIIIPLLVFILFLQSKNVSKMWLNDTILWRTSFINERSPRTKFNHGSDLFNIDPKLSFEFVTDAAPDFDFRENYAITITYCYIIHQAKGVPIERKIEEFHKIKDRLGNLAIWHIMYNITLLEGNDKQIDEAIENIHKLAQDPEYRIQDAELQDLLNFELGEYCKKEHRRFERVCHHIKDDIKKMEKNSDWLKKNPPTKHGRFLQPL